LTKTYFETKCFRTEETITALNHVFLEIPVGELCCLLGHNGAGKTTLINILTGTLSYQQGKITINDKDLQ
jgi:ABC-type multidrug transport system ATPase subunit